RSCHLTTLLLMMNGLTVLAPSLATTTTMTPTMHSAPGWMDVVPTLRPYTTALARLLLASLRAARTPSCDDYGGARYGVFFGVILPPRVSPWRF
ncbi:MAG: hypothetical protein QGH07_17140, partial [Alphaproteobacteria bacterium]|nr:hypothetical protein [Alphaproteobacteria bacterium]